MKRGGILLVVPSLRAGGAERAAVWLVRAFAARRDANEVALAVFNGNDRAYEVAGRVVDLRAPASARGVSRLWRGPRNALARVLRLARLIRAERPARIFGFTESANLPLVLAALLAGRRRDLVISVHRDPARIPWHHALAARILYPLAGVVAAVSRGAAASLERRLELPSGVVRVLRNPVDREAVNVAASLEPSEDFFAPSAGPFFLAAGRLVPGKDFAALLAIFARPECSRLRLAIIGEGPERERLARRIEELGLSDRVLLAGHLGNPFAAMARARALLMTSRHEGFPMVLVEAMACGCPVVAFDCDHGPREAIRDGETGFLVAPGDAPAFAARVARLAEDDALRDRLRAASLAAVAEFSSDAAASRWLEAR